MGENNSNENNNADQFELESRAAQQVASALKNLSAESRLRVINSVMALMGTPMNTSHANYSNQSNVSLGSNQGNPNQQSVYVPPFSNFSDDRSLSPKEFLFQKKPTTDVERVACLAYYLTHYRDTPHFKTLDISLLNTEAAQRKFSNAALTVKNSVTTGYLVSSHKGQRQLSANGEQFVLALPDRDAAKLAMSGRGGKRKTKKKNKNEIE